MVKLDRCVPAASKQATILCKLEMQNPGGSLKDRIALNMIEEAEARGDITPGKTTIIDFTSGITGIGYYAKGYKCIVIMPKVRPMLERYLICRQFGAEVRRRGGGRWRRRGRPSQRPTAVAAPPSSQPPPQHRRGGSRTPSSLRGGRGWARRRRRRAPPPASRLRALRRRTCVVALWLQRRAGNLRRGRAAAQAAVEEAVVVAFARYSYRRRE